MTRDVPKRRAPRCPVCGRREAIADTVPPDEDRPADPDPRALGVRWRCGACGYAWRAADHA